MKKIFLTAFMVMSIIIINAQTPVSGNSNYKEFSQFNNDTLSYLKTNFETNKAFYIGKPLSVLLNDMEFSPLSNIYSRDNASNCRGLGFSFLTFKQLGFKIYYRQKYLTFGVDFENPIPSSEFEPFLLSIRGIEPIGWTAAEKSFYGTRVIKDIVVNVINDK